MFGVKDSVPISMCSNVVYKFTCAGSDACYVREHLHSDCNSHIYEHLKGSESCRNLCSEVCFSILDSALTSFQLKIKEALLIEWERPSLNKQIKHVDLTLPL